MSEIKTKIRTYNDVIDLFGEEKAADMLSEALDWSTNVSATTGRAPRMARFPTPSPALPHRNASTTITGAWRTLSLPKTLS